MGRRGTRGTHTEAPRHDGGRSRTGGRRSDQAAHAGESVLPDLTTRSMLGDRLKAMRTAKGLTLQDVADATGLSRTFVGLVEQGKSEIAVARLLRVADFFGVTIHDLISSGADPAVEIVPHQVARRVPTGEEGVALTLLATRSDRVSQPFLVELAAHTQLDGLAHSGDEWVTCLDGTVRVRIAEVEHDLHVGDTLFYPGRLTHGYFNQGDDAVRLIGAVVRFGL
jgi:transcriptional regulator with XRE-family HTH domain